MRVLVIGAGAVGCFIGARLALAGSEVVLVGRTKAVEAIEAGGLVLLEPSGEHRVEKVGAASSLADAFRAGRSYDLALVTVKAYDTAAVVTELGGAVATPPPLLTLQNGIGNEEMLAAAFGASSVLAGAIDTPVSVPAAGTVQVHRKRYRAGLAAVGSGAPLAQAADLLREAGLQMDVFSDYRRLKWTKLLLNLPANAQCAILDWSPAQVMADPDAARLEARAWQEALFVMAALRVRPVTLAGYPVPLVAPLARELPAALLAAALRRLVSGGRGTKMPSLHAALVAGKPSEVAWLNGAVARHGQQLGVPTPVNQALASVLTALTDDRERRAEWRGRPDRLASLAIPSG